MSSRQIVRRSGSTADENKLEATCSGDDESVYAGSSSSSRGSSWGSSLSSSDGYLHSADSCCSDRDDCRHYEEIRDDGWAVQRHLSAEHHHHRLCAYPRAASGDVIQTQSRWTASSLLCGVSTLLAACSLSSLTVCIAVTGISLTRIGASGRATSDVVQSASQRNDNIADEAQIPRETERMLLTPLTDYRSSKQNNTATQSERRRTARYNWGMKVAVLSQGERDDIYYCRQYCVHSYIRKFAFRGSKPSRHHHGPYETTIKENCVLSNPSRHCKRYVIRKLVPIESDFLIERLPVSKHYRQTAGKSTADPRGYRPQAIEKIASRLHSVPGLRS